ncbi:MAG: uridine kinase [Bacilli bacterium]|nr:uridine kinase [Bacilli bacterium]
MSTYIIGIAGGTASGKTTVAKKLYKASSSIGNVTLIRLDDYYKRTDNLTLEERQKLNYDHPDSIDFDLLKQNLYDLKHGLAVDKPLYDFTIHNRSENVEHLEPTSVIIVEGILVFVDEEVRNMFDMKIYVDTPDDIRFIRRLIRDMNERGRTLESVYSQYLETVRPMHMQFIEPSKKYADVIIPEGGNNPIVIDLLSSKIASLIENKLK